MNLDDMQQIANRVVGQRFTAGFDSLNARDRVFFLIWAHGGQVANGGHISLFYNSSADLYSETLDALRLIGLPQHAALLERAGTLLFGDHVPRDMERRNRILDEIPGGDASCEEDEELDAIDAAFYASGGSDRELEALDRWYHAQQES
ncbi:MAG: DUF4375 domain-containing protein [Bryobacterales bacterium]|nr:DUF4375 domain-containing protein [Bryobacterales bacterium]